MPIYGPFQGGGYDNVQPLEHVLLHYFLILSSNFWVILLKFQLNSCIFLYNAINLLKHFLVLKLYSVTPTGAKTHHPLHEQGVEIGGWIFVRGIWVTLWHPPLNFNIFLPQIIPSTKVFLLQQTKPTYMFMLISFR